MKMGSSSVIDVMRDIYNASKIPGLFSHSRVSREVARPKSKVNNPPLDCGFVKAPAETQPVIEV